GEEEARTAARLSLGSLGRALGFLAADDEEHGPLDQLRRRAFQIVRAALEPGRTHVLAMDYPPAKARLLLALFGFVEEWLRDLAALLAGAPEGVIHADAAQALEALGKKAGVQPGRVPASLAELERARELARGNVNPQLVVGSLARGLRRALVGSGRVGPTRSAPAPTPSRP